MKAIGELLEQRRSADEEVAFEWADGCEVHRWWSDFVGDVVALNGRIARAHPGPWVLITEDAYAFAVGLFALWHAGQRAIIPPNHQPATLSSLETRRVGVLTDRPDWSEPGTSLHPLALEEPGER